MKIVESVKIAAPLETVFAVFTDLDLAEQRIDGIKQIDVLEGQAQLEVGTKWRETRQMYGKEATEVMWVTELSQNASYVVEADSRGTKYKSTYTFQQQGDGVKVTLEFSGEPHSLGAKLLVPLAWAFKGAAAKALRQDLTELKTAAETSET